MNNLDKAYIAIDLHQANSMIGYTDKEGKLLDLRQLETNGQNLINSIIGIPAEHKSLTIEQTYMVFAMAEQLAPYGG